MSTQPVTFDPSQSYQPAMSGKPSFDPTGSYQAAAVPKTPETGIVSGVVRGVSNLAAMPGQFYDAITKGPQTDEEKSVHENGVDTPQGHLPGSLALPFWRLVGKPMADADDKAQQYETAAASEQNPDVKKQLLDAAGAYRIGAKVPMVGPLAASLAERGAYGEQGASKLDPKGGSGWNNQNADLSGATAEATTYAAAPSVTKAAGVAVLDSTGPAVRATTRAVNTVLAKAPGTVGTTLGGAAGAAVGHATGLPYGGEVGAGIGTAIGAKLGTEVLPKVQIPGEGFGLPNRVTGGPASAPQFQPAPPEPQPAPLGPEAPTRELVQSQGLAEGAKPAPEPAKALMDLPVHAVNQAVQELGANAPIPSLTARANQIANLAVEGAGGKIPPPLQPNVPLRNQGGIITPTATSDAEFARRYPNETMTSGMTPDAERLWQEGAGFKTEPLVDVGAKVRSQMPAAPRSGGLPEGHTSVDSSALKSYKYNPDAQELETVTQNGQHYIHGDVSQAQADAFESAPSKGKAWNDIRKNSTLVAKVVNGKRVPVKPVISDEDSIPEDEWQAGHELETQVEGSRR